MGNIYVGVDNQPKRIKAIWVGVNGVPKKVKNAWVGVNNVPKIIYTSIGKPTVTHVDNDGTVYWTAVSGVAYYKVRKYSSTSYATSTSTTDTHLKLQSMGTNIIAVAVLAYDANGNYSISDQYAINWIVITFNGNGGTPSKTSSNILSGNSIGTLPTATREGYDFDNWWDSNDYRVYETTPFYSSAIIYAHWIESILYWTVTFNANGGSCSVTSRDVVRGSAVGVLPSASYSGYDFDGWYVNGSYITKNYIPQSDCTAIAHWSLILQESRVMYVDHTGYVEFETATGATSYRVKKYQSGTWYSSAKTYTNHITLQSINTNVSKLAVVTYDDYGNSLTSDNYNIQWVRITFNGNGGTPSTSYYDRIKSTDYYYPMVEEVGELPTASRSGYTFDGWWTDTGSYGSRVYPTAKYSSNITVYAHWKQNTLTKPVITSAVKSTRKVTWTRPSWATKVVLYKSGNSSGTAQDRSIIYASNGHKLSGSETIDNYTGKFLTGTSNTYSNTNYMYEVCVVAWDDDGNHVASDWYTAT